MRLADVRNWLRARRPTATAIPGEDVPGGAAPSPAGADAASAWPAPRLHLAERLWGEGCLLPGGSEEVLRLAAPLGLSAASSLLLVGAGAAGPALRLAGELGVWVSGFERDPVLAALAARRVQRAGVALAKRAVVRRWDPARPSFGPTRCHHALLLEALEEQTEATLSAVAAVLRPDGQVVATQTVSTDLLDPTDPQVRAWCALEGREPPRQGTHWIAAPLDRLGFEIRVCEDIGPRQARQVVAGWKSVLKELVAERPSPAEAAMLVQEAELWLRRVALLRRGALRVVRWHAMSRGSSANAEGPPPWSALTLRSAPVTSSASFPSAPAWRSQGESDESPQQPQIGQDP